MNSQSFRELPFMGVIRVNEAASRQGFTHGDLSWSNLGQGQPEVGALPGAPPRLRDVDIEDDDHAYGPVEGLPELREAVAAHYNRLYRRGLPSQYTAENVLITPGGRVALSRCGATLAPQHLGHFTPDYTAYEDLLRTFDQARPHKIELRPEDGFRIEPAALDAIVAREKLDALLISNPCNPTGVAIRGDELDAWLELARRNGSTLLFDEYYSHFVYDEPGGSVSAAALVEDVDRDPVVLFDGLTKCFRYPGWRVGWALAPKDVVRSMTAAGSFLDGGASRPIQRAAIRVLEPARADQELEAVRQAFAAKQRLTIDRLEAMGIRVPYGPTSTFYVFASIAELPAPLDDGEAFMNQGFTCRVLTVPGAYFDVDPSPDRPAQSRLASFVRVSFGPPRDNVEAGLDRLGTMLAGVVSRDAQTA